MKLSHIILENLKQVFFHLFILFFTFSEKVLNHLRFYPLLPYSRMKQNKRKAK